MTDGQPDTLFERFRPHALEADLTDFGKRLRGGAGTPAISVRSTRDAADLIAHAAAHDVPLRVRGGGHSLNGSSLPQQGELLVRTDRLVSVSFEREGTVSVGAGLALWPLRCYLWTLGFDLPVFNDGDSGPSVGGYVAAGGIGPGSERYGGFWANVDALTVVDGRGRVRQIERRDADFAWFFGAMGQLGMVTEARLDIVPAESGQRPPYPLGTSVVVDDELAAQLLGEARIERPPVDERLLWFTLFVPPDDLQEAYGALDALEATHPDALEYRTRYIYPMKDRGLIAPLVYPAAGDFVAVGMWGTRADDTEDTCQRVLALERAFMDLTRARRWYRYVQTELSGDPEQYRIAFGADRYAELLARMDEADPRQLFNRGNLRGHKTLPGAGHGFIAPAEGGRSPAASAPWSALAGPIGGGFELTIRSEHDRDVPWLVGPQGDLRLEITPLREAALWFVASERWAVSYRGPRKATDAEQEALTRLADLLERELPEPAAAARRFASTRTDASDLPDWLAALPGHIGDASVELTREVDVARARPHVAHALDIAARRRVELRVAGLPWCAVPWPDHVCTPAPDAPSAAQQPPECGRCVDLRRCPGPRSGTLLRPRTAETPWLPLRRAVDCWRAAGGHPPEAVWRRWWSVLAEMLGGSFSNAVPSVTLALDAAAGALQPGVAIAAFYRPRSGRPPHAAEMLEHLTPLWEVEGCLSQLEPLRPVVSSLPAGVPIYPGLVSGPEGQRVSLYIETDRLAPPKAWQVAHQVVVLLGLPWHATKYQPRLLGLSVEVGRERIAADLYLHWRGLSDAPWTPPGHVRELAGPGSLIATVRLGDPRHFAPRKWDVPWWPIERGPDHLLQAMGLDAPAGAALRSLIEPPRPEGFTLVPTTLGIRDQGRRIYLKVA